jgi:hypothetical protein
VVRDRRRHRTQESVVLLVLQVAAMAVHIVPRLVYASASERTTTRIVAYLAELGPLWVLAFGVTALGLGAALWWRRGLAQAHVLAAGVWVFYDVGLWIGALAEHPRGTVLFPVVVVAVIVVHVILAASYNEDGDYLERST